ncbi:MAG: cobalt-precorrin 5A hydrolase [Filifactor alocis]|nr:cobalt-precorrin 5A hydrolase [Filifactor alocis]
MKKKTAIIAITPRGRSTALTLRKHLNAQVWLPLKLKGEEEEVSYYEIPFRDIVEDLFVSYENLIFVMAVGIVVRAVAPLLKDKSKDPAVVVMDEGMNYAISLLSGHVGGANELAQEIARDVGCIAVVTTATDVNEKTAWDIVAKEWKAYSYRDNEIYKALNLAEISGQKIVACIDTEEDVLFDLLKKQGVEEDRIFFCLEEALSHTKKEDNVVLFTTSSYVEAGGGGRIRVEEKAFEVEGRRVFPVVKKCYALGVGCRRGIEPQLLKKEFVRFLDELNVHPHSIAVLSSIDIKKDEEAILVLAEELGVDFLTYTKEEIRNVEDRMPDMERSEFVFRQVGVYNVSQSCAYLAGRGEIVKEKTSCDRSTFSLAKI